MTSITMGTPESLWNVRCSAGNLIIAWIAARRISLLIAGIDDTDPESAALTELVMRFEDRLGVAPGNDVFRWLRRALAEYE